MKTVKSELCNKSAPTNLNFFLNGQSEVLNPVSSLSLTRLHLKISASMWLRFFYRFEKC